MKTSSSLLIFASFMLLLIFTMGYTDATAFIDEKLPTVSNSENDASLRNKKETGSLTAQQIISSPLRRHHLKFGVLGKRNDAPNTNNNYEEWLNYMRERRAGRPQYGLLG